MFGRIHCVKTITKTHCSEESTVHDSVAFRKCLVSKSAFFKIVMCPGERSVLNNAMVKRMKKVKENALATRSFRRMQYSLKKC